jgi:hypothetical protein
LKKAYPIVVLCDVIQVSRSGYYAWRARDDSARKKVTRMVVGWSLGDRITRRLVMDAPRVGIGRRRPEPGLVRPLYLPLE